MQKLTIVKSDGIVGVDGVFRDVNCSDLPENFHALEWDQTTSYGEVQWAHWPNKDRWPDRPPNTKINNIREYTKFIDRWNAAAPDTSSS